MRPVHSLAVIIYLDPYRSFCNIFAAAICHIPRVRNNDYNAEFHYVKKSQTISHSSLILIMLIRLTQTQNCCTVVKVRRCVKRARMRPLPKYHSAHAQADLRNASPNRGYKYNRPGHGALHLRSFIKT